MTPETCKQLLEMGILQAYADGLKIEVRIGGTWLPLHSPHWDCHPQNYRIKPKHTFEVGDLVKTDTGVIGTIIEIFSSVPVARISNGSTLVWRLAALTKVRKVRTPFTFEQAVNACAEHGFRVRYGTLESPITELDHNSIRIDGQYLYYNQECLETVFTSDNTPFCNINYEPTTTH